jgi:lysophospholipase L1-like esterase
MRPASVTGHGPRVRIVFVGDSLVHRSAGDHGMLAAIQAGLAGRHPDLSIEVIDASVNGSRIADVRDRLDEDALSLRPSAIVLYFDSDVSDVDERPMSKAERQATRAAYERTLRDVLSRSRASGARVFLSGPTVLGERPRGRNPRDAQLDAYRRINRRVARSLSVTYIDMRRAFLAGRPPGAPADADRGLLTEDGEHHNAMGAQVAGAQFLAALDAWLRSTRVPHPG